MCNAPGAFSEPTVALAAGYGSPEAMEVSPVPSASPPTSFVSSVMQVRRYSWRSYDKNVAYGKKREFVGTNKQTNTNSSLFPPQKPLLSKVHLTNVVRKIGQQERSKGKIVTVNKFNAHCSKGGKGMTSLSHSNRESSDSMTVGNSGKGGISSDNNKYCEIKIKNNSASKGKQGEERDEALRLPDIIKRKGMMTSRLHNTITREQQKEVSLDALVAKQYKSSLFRSRSSDSLGFRKAVQSYNKIALRLPDIIKRKGMMTSRLHNTITREQQKEVSLDALVAKQYKSSLFRSRSSDSLGFRKAVQSYNKIAAILIICFGMIMQLLEAFSHFARCKSKSLIGNSRIDSVDEGVWRCYLFAVYFLFECRTSLWEFRHRIWPRLILEGLWMGNNAINTIDKRFYKLTFRLVLAKYWLRNLLHGNVCRTNVAIGIGNTGDARDANNVCLCPYSDLWASCHIYLCRDMGILGFPYKIGSFCVLIYLYMGKIRSLWLSCKQASFFLAFPNKLCTLVYFVSKDCLLDKISCKKYQCANLVWVSPLEKAYTGIKPFWLGLERVVTSGDPLDMAYKRGH